MLCLELSATAGAISWGAHHFVNPVLRRNFKPMVDQLSEKINI
jgi:hypothetical protein